MQFTPVSALVGGALIGLSATLVLLTHGRVAGISGIFSGLFLPGADARGFRAAFVVGLLLAGVALTLAYPAAYAGLGGGRLWLVALAGLFVGFGTRLGSGCTSGHGVCGLSRFSARSLVATVTFIATGALSVMVLRAALGGLR